MNSTTTVPKKSLFKSLSSTKVTKAELKQADVVTQELQKGFQWTTQHMQIVLGLVGGFLIAGLAWVGYSSYVESAETKAQESYFKAEKQFMKQREALNKDPKAPAAKTESPNEIAAIAPTGDFEKDYPTQSQALTKIIQDFPGSAASRMAGLTLAAEQMKYSRYDLALKTLEPLKTSSDLLSVMVLVQKGKAQASQKDCKSALETWARAQAIKGASLFAPEIQLHQGLCFEAGGDKTKAEETYNKLIASFKDSPYAHSAEHYLRLLHR